VTIQDLGSIGELIAAGATIATLLYLALQLRENATAIRAEARRAHRSTASNANSMIAQDSKVAALFNSGLRDFDGLPPDEHTQFAFLLSEIITTQQSIYEEVESGILDESHFESSETAMGPLIRSTGGRQWWAKYGSGYSVGFRDFVDNQILREPTS